MAAKMKHEIILVVLYFLFALAKGKPNFVILLMDDVSSFSL
jgi:hypothetical protein